MRAARVATPTRATATKEATSRVRSPGLRIALHPQSVAGPEDRLDDHRCVRIALDLAAQVPHVGIDRPLVPLELVPMDAVDELVP